MSTVCELEHGRVESSLIFPAIKWWFSSSLCGCLPEDKWGVFSKPRLMTPLQVNQGILRGHPATSWPVPLRHASGRWAAARDRVWLFVQHSVVAATGGTATAPRKNPETVDWLVVYLPLWKIWKSVGVTIPNIWKNQSHVPNHQPVEIWVLIASMGQWFPDSWRNNWPKGEGSKYVSIYNIHVVTDIRLKMWTR